MAILYYVIISAALFVSLGLATYRNREYKLPVIHVMNVFILAQVTGLISARLFHVFYEQWAVYSEKPELIFEFWSGGYVYYAGIIGGTFASLLYLKLNKEPWMPYLNLYILPVSIGSAIGRWACVMAGCCFGQFCDLPWAVSGRHPTAIYSFIWELGLFLILWGLEKS
ncbi:MAG: prolipoprotein diacylglyceryl transferase family protein, partial [Bdellovibrionota bacterium]